MPCQSLHLSRPGNSRVTLTTWIYLELERYGWWDNQWAIPNLDFFNTLTHNLYIFFYYISRIIILILEINSSKAYEICRNLTSQILIRDGTSRAFIDTLLCILCQHQMRKKLRKHIHPFLPLHTHIWWLKKNSHLLAAFAANSATDQSHRGV